MDNEKRDDFLREAMADLRSEQKAFDEAGIEYGTVTFTHSCGGKATATRIKTSNGPRSRMGGGGSCEKCGVNWIY